MSQVLRSAHTTPRASLKPLRRRRSCVGPNQFRRLPRAAVALEGQLPVAGMLNKVRVAVWDDIPILPQMNGKRTDSDSAVILKCIIAGSSVRRSLARHRRQELRMRKGLQGPIFANVLRFGPNAEYSWLGVAVHRGSKTGLVSTVPTSARGSLFARHDNLGTLVPRQAPRNRVPHVAPARMPTRQHRKPLWETTGETACPTLRRQKCRRGSVESLEMESR
jgi:hypothetical protein